ncbi:hypothetical protein NP233_g11422 [Leucocoprinus birnbaumii]|uniref:Uncharacterized protein n=1 Tax=Leucocoprinus birnbaumii TaxID=56174 RepID=A0AAD5VGU7_9AGAR|nr:hypothetical protein NP233_g11422 [Leucocoprinus birnbaumii]
MHVPSADGNGYIFPVEGQPITLDDIDFTEYNRAIPIYNPLLASLGIIYENGTLNYENLMRIANRVLNSPDPTTSVSPPRNYRRRSPLPFRPSHNSTRGRMYTKERPRFPFRIANKLPCHHPLSQATTIIEDEQNKDDQDLEVNSMSFTPITPSTPSLSSSTTQTSSTSVITEEDVISIIEDPLQGLSNTLFNIVEEPEPVNPSLIASLPRIDDPVIEHPTTPSVTPTSLDTTERNDPTDAVAALSLNDEDADGSFVADFEMTEDESTN